MKFNPFPILESKRLHLRRLSINDIDDLFEMRSNEVMTQYTDGITDKTIDDTIKYLRQINSGVEKGQWIIWAIILKSENKLIGTITIWNFSDEYLQGELGYGLNHNYWSNGFMSEAIDVIINYAFDNLKMDILEAYTEEANLSSYIILKKLNFKYTKTILEAGINKNTVYNYNVYQMKNDRKD
jgi:ribosomal-protein-alanine N-acetyltransferase